MQKPTLSIDCRNWSATAGLRHEAQLAADQLWARGPELRAVLLELEHTAGHTPAFRAAIELRFTDRVQRCPMVAAQSEREAVEAAFSLAARLMAGARRSHSGRVVRLHREEGFGVIERDDGSQLHFERAEIPDAFERLTIGSEVRFEVDPGDSPSRTAKFELVSHEAAPDPRALAP